MDLTKVKRDDWILAGVALVLAIDLLAFPWFDISAGPFSVTFTATGSPDGWAGVLALLCVLALIIDLAIERFSPQTKLPALGGGRESTRFVLAIAAAALMALKFVLHIHFSLFGWGFYLGVLLVAALVFLARQARGGVAFAMPGSIGRMGHPVATAGPDRGPEPTAPPSGPAEPPTV